MIISFKDKRARLIFDGEHVRNLPEHIQERAKDKMEEIHIAGCPEDLMIPPGNRLEKLHGTRKEQYSIRVNNQWRLCFKFENGNAYEVELIDYH